MPATLSKNWRLALGIPVLLYIIAVQVSMAGMEFFSWLTLATYIVFRVIHWGDKSLRNWEIGPDLSLWIYFDVVLLSSILNYELLPPASEAVGYVRWILLLYTFFLTLKLIPYEKMEKWTSAFLVVTTIAGFYAFLQFLTGLDFVRTNAVKPVASFYRATGFFNIAMTLAYSIGMAGCLALAIALYSQGKKRLLAWLAFAAATLGIIASLTRAAWIGYFIAVMILVFFWKKKAAIWPAMIGIVVAFGMYSINDGIRLKINGLLHPTQDNSIMTRTLVWEANLEMVKDYPWVGVGVNRNSLLTNKYLDKIGHPEKRFESHAHNNFIQMLVVSGPVGLAAFLFFNFFFLRLAFQLFRKSPQPWIKGLALGSFAAQIFLHIGGLTECNFTDGEVNHFLLFQWALLSVFSAKDAAQ